VSSNTVSQKKVTLRWWGAEQVGQAMQDICTKVRIIPDI